MDREPIIDSGSIAGCRHHVPRTGGNLFHQLPPERLDHCDLFWRAGLRIATCQHFHGPDHPGVGSGPDHGTYFRQGIGAKGDDLTIFVTRPLSLVFLIVILLPTGTAIRNAMKGRRQADVG